MTLTSLQHIFFANVLNKTFLPEQGTKQSLDLRKLGKHVTKRIKCKSWIWYTVNKERLLTFSNNSKTTSAKVNGGTLQIRKEKKLMEIILVASRN